MATLSAVIVPAKVLKDGKHKIRIAVAHNGETRYIVTDIVINSPKEFKNGMIVRKDNAAFLNAKLRGILQNYQEIMDDIQYADGLPCAELVAMLKTTKNVKNCSLETIYEEYMSALSVKATSMATYKATWAVLTRHLNKNMLVAHITHGTLVQLEKSLRDKRLSASTICNYMHFLITLVNYAKKCGYVFYRVDPLCNYRSPRPEIRDAWLTVEEIKKFRDYPFTKKNHIRTRDIFMLSYYLGGINIADLMNIDFSQQKERICYVRQKTENMMKANSAIEFEIPEEARKIIEHAVGADGYILHNKKEAETNILKYNLTKIGKMLGFKRLIYYSARKSFSQHAFELGIETSVIDYVLGHSLGVQGKSLYHYVYVSPDMASAAVRKVLDNLK